MLAYIIAAKDSWYWRVKRSENVGCRRINGILFNHKMNLKRFDENENDEHIKKGNEIKPNDGFNDGFYSPGEEEDSEDDVALALRNMNRVYRRGNFRGGKRLSRGNQAMSF